jgi:hypothetical protein
MNDSSPNEQKQFYKQLLAPTMSLEEKMDELWHLPDDNLQHLLKQFEYDGEYEICHAIKSVLDAKKQENWGK